MSSASQVYFLGIIAPSVNAEDVMVMAISAPPEENVERLMKMMATRTAMKGINVRVLMKPPSGGVRMR
jgi:hypothetical protein